MRKVTSIAAMQRLARQAHREGALIGFVPTMGYLHAGHISLVHRARQLVGRNGKVVVSIYVNPTQFAPHEDLAQYPRDLKRDSRLCRDAGVDYLFVPTDGDMYPQGFSTYVVEETLSRVMEGVSRPTHFRGVTTVVAKLFNIVLPDLAVFGAKDYQQAAIIRRMVRDLNFPLKLVVAPTVREADGLAMSSRNKYLAPAERPQALALTQSIAAVKSLLRRRPTVSAQAARRCVAELLARHPAARLDYVDFFHPDSLEPVKQVRPGTHMALAVFVGRTRLIDNARL